MNLSKPVRHASKKVAFDGIIRGVASLGFLSFGLCCHRLVDACSAQSTRREQIGTVVTGLWQHVLFFIQSKMCQHPA